MRTNGYTMVELLVIVAIVAILSSVAVPAYVTYINRARQADAASALLVANAEQEQWKLDNGAYADVAGCLPSFGGDCGAGNTVRLEYYTVQIVEAGTDYYRMEAVRELYGRTDKIWISSATNKVQVSDENAIKLSIVDLVFD